MMLSSKSGIALGVLLFLSGVIYVLLGYFTVRTDFEQLIFLYSLAFIFYFFIYRLCSQNEFFFAAIAAAILFRFSLLFYLPNLSDDFYRFVWDGRLIAQSINPYQFPPSEIMKGNITPMDASLFNNLNSQNFYSVYPPVSQAIFFIASLLSSGNIFWNIVALKIFIFLFEIGTIVLLYRLVQFFQLKKEIVLIYALNPLVIIELTGNIHFEAGMIFFTLLAVYLALRRNIFSSAFSISLAIMIKLLPLIFVPFFFRQLGAKRFFQFVFFIVLSVFMLLFPILDFGLVKNFMASVSLYFNHFSFNASFYYIARLFSQTFDYRILLLNFKILTPVFLGIVTLLFFQNQKQESYKWLFTGFLFVLTVYFLFASTVHPWYIIPLIAFSLFTNFSFPIVWSALIPLTYITYATFPHRENLFLIGMEYLIVTGFFVYEFSSGNLTMKQFSNKNKSNSLHIIS